MPPEGERLRARGGACVSARTQCAHAGLEEHACVVRVHAVSMHAGREERHPLDPCRRSERLVVDESRFVHPSACTVQLRWAAGVRLRLQPKR